MKKPTVYYLKDKNGVPTVTVGLFKEEKTITRVVALRRREGHIKKRVHEDILKGRYDKRAAMISRENFRFPEKFLDEARVNLSKESYERLPDGIMFDKKVYVNATLTPFEVELTTPKSK